MKHVFLDGKTVTGLVYDNSNNAYFECSFEMFDLPVDNYANIANLTCKCGNVPKKDNSHTNHFCVHLACVFEHLVDRRIKNSPGYGNPLNIIERNDKEYILNDIKIPVNNIPKESILNQNGHNTETM